MGVDITGNRGAPPSVTFDAGEVSIPGDVQGMIDSNGVLDEMDEQPPEKGDLTDKAVALAGGVGLSYVTGKIAGAVQAARNFLE